MSAHTPFQSRVAAWMEECFGPTISADKVERNDRFIEEALEFAQSTGYTAERAHALVRYVFARPAGEPGQEVGGVMVTLAAACNVHGINIEAEARREVDRITTPEMVEKIRAKQAAKPTGSALPIALGPQGGPLAEAPAGMPQPGQRYQHRWGTTYRVIGKAQLQSCEPLADYADVIVYQSEGEDRLIWVRPVSEFVDGRFAGLTTAPDLIGQADDDTSACPGFRPNYPTDGNRCYFCGRKSADHAGPSDVSDGMTCSAAEQGPGEAWAQRKTQRSLFPVDSVPTIGDTAEVEGSKVVYTWKGEPFELGEGWVRRLGAHLRPLLGQTVVYCYWRRLGAVERTSE